jgi:WD40 repeat protein
VLSVAFAADGTLLACGSADGLVNVYEVATGNKSRSLPGHQGGATAVVFSLNNKLVICGEGYGGVRAWELNSGLAYSCPGADSRAKAFTIDRLMNSIGLTSDGKLLATCASSVNNEFVDSVKLWNVHTGELHRDFAAENIHGRPVALSPDGSLIATGGKSVKLWDVRTGKMVGELFGHLKRTQSIVFSGDGRLVVAGGSYGTVNLWETRTGRHLVTLFAFPQGDAAQAADDWLAYTPEGFFDGSPAAEKYIAWRTGDKLELSSEDIAGYRSPEKLAHVLNLDGPQH